MSNKVNLAVVDASREAFGEYRTVCDCRACTINCEWIPGYLIPDDLTRLAGRVAKVNALTKTDMTFEEWALDNLLASPGALVFKNGVPFRVPTLVPARGEDGHSCKFLAVNTWAAGGKSCQIHEDAPFGCAFFYSHLPEDYVQRLSGKGLESVILDWRANGPYAKLWTFLNRAGRVAPSPAENRERLREAWVKEELERRAKLHGKSKG